MLDQLLSSQPGDHLIEVYERDEFLATTVRDFVAPGLHRREPVVVVATPEHRAAFDAALRNDRVDVDGARAAGLYIELDARDLLAGFMRDGMPDRDLFMASAGELVAGLVPLGPVRAYGEMVALLWDDGYPAASIALEDLWNDLAQVQPFTLLCAYPAACFASAAATAQFRRVCDQHSAVIPSERYSRATGPDSRQRVVAELQQEAIAAEAERTELQLANDQLREAERMRKEFVAMVVHDIRTPASVISGFLEILRHEIDSFDRPQVEEFLDTCLHAGSRIHRLIDDILTVSQLESGEFACELEALDLADIVCRAVATVGTATGGVFEVVAGDGLPKVWADEAHQVQILENLLMNAVKFSPPGSPVTVSLSAQDGYVAVAVADCGVGIDPADFPRLFRPFSRIANGGGAKGSGLGLYIAKSMVEGQGGTLTCESAVGSGATFTYTVPAMAAP